jgi:hypothetical protein
MFKYCPITVLVITGGKKIFLDNSQTVGYNKGLILFVFNHVRVVDN